VMQGANSSVEPQANREQAYALVTQHLKSTIASMIEEMRKSL